MTNGKAVLVVTVEFRIPVGDVTAAVVLNDVLKEKGNTQFSNDCSIWDFSNVDEKLISTEVE